MKPIVYIARKIPSIAAHLLQDRCELRIHEGNLPPTRPQLLEGVRGAAGILSLLSDRIDAEVCETAGATLRVVSNFAVGFNNIDVDELRKRSIAIGNTPDVLTDATADIALALILAAARRLKSASHDVLAGNWQTWEPLGWVGQDLTAGDGPKTLGIVGMGRIGQAVARRLCGGWGMRLLYTSRHPKPEVDERWNAEKVELATLLEQSDIVSLHVPLSPETTHLMGAKQFDLMKPTAILVNTARGEVIDQIALQQALESRSIFAAGLDVCTPEPLPTDHPLLKLDNCLVLPHIGSATEATRNAMAERAARNILAGLEGSPLPYPV